MGGRRNECARQEHRIDLKRTFSLTSYASGLGREPDEGYNLNNNFGWVILGKTQVPECSYFPNIDNRYKKPDVPGRENEEVTYVFCIKDGGDGGAVDGRETQTDISCMGKQVSYDLNSGGDYAQGPGWWDPNGSGSQAAGKNKKKKGSSGASADSGDDKKGNKKGKSSQSKEGPGSRPERKKRSTSCFGSKDKSDSGAEGSSKKDKKKQNRQSAGAEGIENYEEGEEIFGTKEIESAHTRRPSKLIGNLKKTENNPTHLLQTASGTNRYLYVSLPGNKKHN